MGNINKESVLFFEILILIFIGVVSVQMGMGVHVGPLTSVNVLQIFNFVLFGDKFK